MTGASMTGGPAMMTGDPGVMMKGKPSPRNRTTLPVEGRCRRLTAPSNG